MLSARFHGMPSSPDRQPGGGRRPLSGCHGVLASPTDSTYGRPRSSAHTMQLRPCGSVLKPWTLRGLASRCEGNTTENATFRSVTRLVPVPRTSTPWQMPFCSRLCAQVDVSPPPHPPRALTAATQGSVRFGEGAMVRPSHRGPRLGCCFGDLLLDLMQALHRAGDYLVL